MKFSRERYEYEFAQINASWAYENKGLTAQDKEVIYSKLLEKDTTLQPNIFRGKKMSSSIYLYPGTNVLINHFDIRDEEKLSRQERVSTAYRAMELRFNPVKQTFDFDHLKKIHHHLFQDVYPFAGQVRLTNIGKNDFWFCDMNQIPRLSDYVFSELKSEKFLKGLPQDVFAERAAYFYTEINFMHPFREGNGRAIREFFGDLARNNGLDLNWDRVPKEEYFQAVKLTDDPKQRAELVKVFNKCLSPMPENLNLEEWKDLDQPKKLKDVLKEAEGLPKESVQLNAKILNKMVDRFKIDSNGKAIRFRFEGEQEIKTIPLEKHPYLSSAYKNQLLDQAASMKYPTIQISKYLEP